MKGRYIFLMSFAFLICSFKGDGLIEKVYPELLGDFEFYKSVADRSVSFAKDGKDRFSITITRKDQIIFSKNGKKEQKMKFSATKMPFLDDPNHILFGMDNSYEPLFYRGDTIIVQSYPIEYQENYFVKRKN
jgi:hypothetical protein